MRMPWRFLLAAAALAMVAFVAAACDDEEERPTAPELSDGVLRVGSDIAYAPLVFFEGGSEKPIGLDVDLAEAMADWLRKETEFQNMGFADLITALQNGEIDVIMSAMTITPDRSQEIDFIAYLNAGTGILVAAGNPQGILAFEDLCGLSVAVQGDTIQAAQVNELNGSACADSRIDLLTFSENPLAVEQLRVGGADAVLADDAVVVNEANLSEGQLEVVVSALEPAPYGIGVRKESSALRAALEDALRRLIDNGTYADILEEWNLTSGSVE